MKYLMIKNWNLYQPKEKLKNETASLPWVKDYTDKEFDADYMNLTFYQRYVLDAVCRLRGRLGHDIPYEDPTWVSRLLHANRTDAPHIPHAIRTLCARGFLIECFVEDTPREGEREGEGEGDIDREGEGEGRLTAAPSLLSVMRLNGVTKSKTASVGDEA